MSKKFYLIEYDNLMKEWDWKTNNPLGLDPKTIFVPSKLRLIGYALNVDIILRLILY